MLFAAIESSKEDRHIFVPHFPLIVILQLGGVFLGTERKKNSKKVFNKRGFHRDTSTPY